MYNCYSVDVTEKSGWYMGKEKKTRSAGAWAQVQFAHIIHQLHCLTRSLLRHMLLLGKLAPNFLLLRLCVSGSDSNAIFPSLSFLHRILPRSTFSTADIFLSRRRRRDDLSLKVEKNDKWFLGNHALDAQWK